MRLPKRDIKHVMETKSGRLLGSLAPDDWIVREVTERDYGIDCYIELSNSLGEVTGDLLSVQLKSEEKIEWKTAPDGTETARSVSIAVETANYWLRLPVPVLLFVADLSENAIYIVDVKLDLRAQFGKLQTQDTVSFKLHKLLSLNSKVGPAMVRALYARECEHSRFEYDLTFLLSNMVAHSNFILSNQMLDCFMEVDTTRHLEFRTLYGACRKMATYLLAGWDLPSLSDVYSEDRRQWKDDFCSLHNQSLDSVLAKLQPVYPKLLERALEIVTTTQGEYWRASSPRFFSLCSTGELRSEIKRIEDRFARES